MSIPIMWTLVYAIQADEEQGHRNRTYQMAS